MPRPISPVVDVWEIAETCSPVSAGIRPSRSAKYRFAAYKLT